MADSMMEVAGANPAGCRASHLAGKRVLITGGLGFIGSNVALEMVRGGAQVTVLDNLDPCGGGAVHNVGDAGRELEIVVGDVLDFGALSSLVTASDIVVNCAASTSHPRSMREPLLDLDANLRGTLNVLEAVRATGRPVRLVHLGTTTQIGRLVSTPADELHPEFPTDVYSANKSVSEKYVLIYAQAHGIAGTVLRLSNTYGPRARIDSAEFTFNNYFVGLAIQGLPITVYGAGEQLRNALYIDDAVEAIVTALDTDATIGRTYLIAHDDHHSVRAIAEQTVAAIGSGSVESVPWPADRQATEFGDAVLSNRRARGEMGWRPTTSLVDGLARTARFYLEHRDEYLPHLRTDGLRIPEARE